MLEARVGLEMPAYYLSVHNYLKIKAALADARIEDHTFLVERLKLVKSPAELAYVRKAAEIADLGMRSIETALAAGATEREVAAEAHRVMMVAGGDAPPSPMNLVSGERTCYAHGLPSDRVLRDGDFIHVEFGGQYRRYCSTIARHFSIGEPSRRARQLHRATHDACQACIAMMRPGVRAEEVHKTALQVIGAAGFGDYVLHTTGYGIAPGFPPAWGETINLFHASQDIIEAGMVLSVEPPIFIHQERIGARLIDCVVIRDGPAEVLSGYADDLRVIGQTG
jgi:Xaa-Pro aminopeptidase